MGLLEQIALEGNIETEIRPFQVAIKASSRTSRSCWVASAGSGDPGYYSHLSSITLKKWAFDGTLLAFFNPHSKSCLNPPVI